MRRIWAGRLRVLVTGLPVLLLLCVVASGCASGGVASQSEQHWREDMGRVTRGTLEQGLEKIVLKHALKMNRTEARGRELYYETVWMTRGVLPSEEAAGVTNARNRIVLTGRRSTQVYRVTWELQNEVTSVSADGWHPDVLPPEVIERFRPIYSDLMLEVRTGIR